MVQRCPPFVENPRRARGRFHFQPALCPLPCCVRLGPPPGRGERFRQEAFQPGDGLRHVRPLQGFEHRSPERRTCVEVPGRDPLPPLLIERQQTGGEGGASLDMPVPRRYRPGLFLPPLKAPERDHAARRLLDLHAAEVEGGPEEARAPALARPCGELVSRLEAGPLGC